MKSVIIGAGKYGEVYASYLKESGVEIVGFLDDDKTIQNSVVCALPVLGGTDLLPELKLRYQVEAIYCPLGNNKLRVELLSKAAELGYAIPNFIHHSVLISPNVQIGKKGVYILANTVIVPHVVLDDYVMISVGANIIHHSCLQKGVFVSNGVNLGASLVAKEYAYVGMGATVMTGVKELGEECLIGAGAVVIRDVEPRAIVAGVPARVIKHKNEN